MRVAYSAERLLRVDALDPLPVGLQVLQDELAPPESTSSLPASPATYSALSSSSFTDRSRTSTVGSAALAGRALDEAAQRTVPPRGPTTTGFASVLPFEVRSRSRDPYPRGRRGCQPAGGNPTTEVSAARSRTAGGPSNEPENLGRAVRRRDRRPRRGVHRVDQLRPPALPPRHPRQPGPRPHARRGRAAHDRRRPSRSSPPSTRSAGRSSAATMEFSIALEDIHTHIERALIAKLGDVGRKLHTGRSRNDQVVTDVKLWVRDAIDELDGLLADLQRAFVESAERERDVDPARLHAPAARPAGARGPLLPGLRREVPARPRAARRLPQARQRPAARGRGAGRHVAADRPRVACASKLGFDAVAANSLDVSSDRDFLLEFVFCLSLIATAPERLGGGVGALVHDGVQLPRPARRVLHRLEHHAAQEEPGRAGADPRQDRPRRSARCSSCSCW